MSGTHLCSSHAERRLQVLSEAKGNALGNAKTLALLEADVVIDVHHLKQDKIIL